MGGGSAESCWLYLIGLVTVSGGGQDQVMESVNKNYVITKQMKLDFQIVLMAKNENEAAYHADFKEIELWTEVDSNWKIIDVSISN